MKYRIEIQPLAGHYVVALKGVMTGDLVKVLTVNASAAEIIRLFCDGYDIEVIVDTLQQKYGIPKERVQADVEALLKRLEKSDNPSRQGVRIGKRTLLVGHLLDQTMHFPSENAPHGPRIGPQAARG